MTRSWISLLISTLLLGAVGAACGGDDDDDDSIDADGDADADSDSDTDGDSDADSDGDGDSDADADGDGDSDADADGDADWPPEVVELCTSVGETLCTSWAACCPDGWPDGQLEECESMYTTECSSELGSQVAGGRVAVNAAGGQDCVDSIETLFAGCPADIRDELKQCEDLVVGLQQEGDACEDDSECTDGLACSWGPDGGGFLGTCVVAPGDGEPCLDGWTCADGLECAANTRCFVPVRLGEACTISHPDPLDPNWVVDDCAEAYYCDAEGLCADRLPGGAPCARDDQCASWWCDGGHCLDDSEPLDWCAMPFGGADVEPGGGGGAGGAGGGGGPGR